jgi:hypothetical protein
MHNATMVARTEVMDLVDQQVVAIFEVSKTCREMHRLEWADEEGKAARSS